MRSATKPVPRIATGRPHRRSVRSPPFTSDRTTGAPTAATTTSTTRPRTVNAGQLGANAVSTAKASAATVAPRTLRASVSWSAAPYPG